MDRCEIPKCRTWVSVMYLGHGVCERHWNQLTADKAKPDALRMALRIETMPVTAMEEAMDGTTKTTKPEAPAEPAPTKKTKAPKKAAATRTPNPKHESKTREEFNGEVVVFAFRLGAKDRDRIHSASGPAGATKFVRSAALAAATGDAKTFEALVAQAKSNLK